MVDDSNVKNLILLSREKKFRPAVVIKDVLATPHASISIVRSRVCFLGSLTVPLLELRANPKAPVSLLQFLLN